MIIKKQEKQITDKEKESEKTKVSVSEEVKEKKISKGKTKREIVVPGEVVVEGPDFLPGEGVFREGNKIISLKYGLVDKSDRFVKIIPLSGAYIPRKGNTVIGLITDNSLNGWFVNIFGPYPSFLTIAECAEYVNKKRPLADYYKPGELIVAKVLGYRGKGLDLTMKGSRGFHKLFGGLIIKIGAFSVPRIIGREGSMIKLIKTKTNTNITIGQNGVIWIKGDDTKKELLAKEAMEFIASRPFVDGLTELVEEFLEKKSKELGINV